MSCVTVFSLPFLCQFSEKPNGIRHWQTYADQDGTEYRTAGQNLYFNISDFSNLAFE